jgi:flagellar biosynthesis regulator FlaF
LGVCLDHWDAEAATDNSECGQGREESTMDAIQLLKNAHEKAKQAFEEIQTASADQRAQLWARLEPELKVHEEMEETAF